MEIFHKRIFKRNDSKNLLIYSREEHLEQHTKELSITKSSTPHLRWHPARQEWVTYSADREKRTAFPPEKFCPLCPSGNLNFPTEIPFNNFEIAVFPNRWSSFNTQNNSNNSSNGHCEVVVYSAEHTDTVAEMPIDRIELLVQAWNDRYNELN